MSYTAPDTSRFGHELLMTTQGIISSCRSSLFLRAFICITISQIGTFLLNNSLYSTLALTNPFLRDIGQTIGIAAGFLLFLIGYLCPRLINARIMIPIIFSALIVCVIVGGIGVATGSPAMLIGAALFKMIFNPWVAVMTFFLLIKLPSRILPFCIGLAMLVSCAGSFLIQEAPIGIQIVLYFLINPVIIAIAAKDSTSLLETTRSNPGAYHRAAARPASFVPLFSNFFLTIFFFQLAFGFSLHFGEERGVGLSSAAIVIYGIILIWVCFDKHMQGADLFIRFLGIAIIGAMILALLDSHMSNRIYSLSSIFVLSCASMGFKFFFWDIVAQVAARNPENALCFICLSTAINAASSTVGAALGTGIGQMEFGESSFATVALLVVIILFIAFLSIGLNGYSFKQVIKDIEPESTSPIAQALKLPEEFSRAFYAPSTLLSKSTAEQPEQQIAREETQIEAVEPHPYDERVVRLAEKFGLTTRECEVFDLLAHGRNGAYIEQKLCISRNTVKAHVKHIYQKLEIHSHQELISVVRNLPKND